MRDEGWFFALLTYGSYMGLIYDDVIVRDSRVVVFSEGGFFEDF